MFSECSFSSVLRLHCSPYKSLLDMAALSMLALFHLEKESGILSWPKFEVVIDGLVLSLPLNK